MARLPRTLAQQGGMAVSRLDGRGFSLRRASPPPRKPGAAKHRSTAIPSPFLGSSAPLRSVTGALRADRLDPLHVEGLSPSGQRDTGGDVNPDCQDAFAPISFGWPHRWPPTPSVPAIDWFARPCFTRSRTPYQKPFPISPSTCVRDDDAEYTRVDAINKAFLRSSQTLIHRRAQVLCASMATRCISRWRMRQEKNAHGWLPNGIYTSSTGVP